MIGLRWLLGILLQFRKWVGLSILAGLATVFSGIGLIGTSAYLISRAALQPSIAVLQVAIVGVRFFGISRGVFRYLERLASHSTNLRILARLRSEFFTALEPLLPARQLSHSSGDLLIRVTADVEVLEQFFVRVASPIVVAALTTAGASLFLGLYDPRLAWILFSGLVFTGVGVPLFSRFIRRGRQAGLLQTRALLTMSISEAVQGLRDLLAFEQHRQKQLQLAALEEQYRRSQSPLIWREALVEALNLILPGLTLLLVLVAAIPLVSSGKLEGFLLAVVCLAALASFEAVLPLGMASQNLEHSLEAARRLLAVRSAPPAVLAPARPLPLDSLQELELKNLCFRYHPEEVWGLTDVSVRIPAGRRVAVVGASGAGKTTIFNLLLRLWEVEPGMIFLNGEEIHKYHQDDVRRVFNAISQRGHLFNRTLRENLRLARPDAHDAEILDALQQVGLEDWFQALPSGLDAILGEHGAQLSGGERQRLLVARAVLHGGSAWLLDEPTVHLDRTSEQRLLQMLLEHSAGGVSLWVQHRLEAMQAMDEILVLRAGRVVERGPHSTLLQAGGAYTALWQEYTGVIDA